MQSKIHIKPRCSNLNLYLVVALIIILFINCSNSKMDESYLKFQVSILKDSLLLKKLGYLDINLNPKDFSDIEIIPINAYRLRKNAKNYSDEPSFKGFIEIEKNRLDGFIYLRKEPIGYIYAFNDGKSWNIFGGVQSIKNSKIKEDIVRTLSKDEISSLYVVIGLDGLWEDRRGKTYVYDFYLDIPAFVPVKDYIHKTVTKDALIYAITSEGYFP